jgi:hypothetical protein
MGVATLSIALNRKFIVLLADATREIFLTKSGAAAGGSKAAGFDFAERQPCTASLLAAYSAVFNFNLLLFSSKNVRRLSAVSSNRIHCS